MFDVLTWTIVSTFSVTSFLCAFIVGKSDDNNLVVEAILDDITQPYCLLLLLLLLYLRFDHF